MIPGKIPNAHTHNSARDSLVAVVGYVKNVMKLFYSC